MDLPPLLVRSSDENKIFLFHKWPEVPSHLSCQMSFGGDITTDCLYTGHVLHYYPVLCCLLGLLAKFQYHQAASYETWQYHNCIRYIKKKEMPEQCLRTLLNNYHILHQSSAGRQDPMKGMATSLLQLH